MHRSIVFWCCVLVIAAPFIIVGQRQATADTRPAFDVASIKVNKSGAKGGGGGFRADRLD